MTRPIKSSLKLLLFVCLIIGGASCANIYHIDVTGYLDPAHPPSLIPGKTVFVVQNAEADNPLLEKEVASKIAKLLEQYGYSLSLPEHADFHLIFRYGMDRGPLRSGSIIINQLERQDITYTYDPDSGTFSSQTVTIPGLTSYVPYSVQNHTRWLTIRVLNVRESRDSRKAEVVWAADTVSEGESTDLRHLLNYILVATFEYFGQDTGRAVRVKMTPQNRQVRGLTEK